MTVLPADALQVHLATMFGAGATFREGQREAIEAVVQDGSRTLVVQRTGWGKSLVYWIATRVRRDEGHGPTLVVSPLLSLMRNQIEAAERLGLRAVTINSANRDDWLDIERDLAADRIDVLFVSAQRFANEDFNARLLPGIRRSIGMFVVDEAHCISDWGHEFVPDYRRIGRLLPSLGPDVPVLGTTATANDRVVADVARQLGDHVSVIRGPLARDTLHLDAIPLRDQAERLAWLAEHLPGMPGAGIVYCLTVADTQRVSGWLRGRGIDARPYNADIAPEEREALEQDLLANRLKALVATVALGMGFDKPDLGFVIHYQRPGSPIAYYQQVGRAGRAVENAYGVLLSGREDDAIAEYFLSTAFPPAARMKDILAALEGADSMTIKNLQGAVNLPYGQIEKALKLLEVDGAVGKDRGRFYRTGEPWEQDEAWVAGVLEARRSELAAMRAYVDTDECRMAFLGRLLNDPAVGECGHCANDGGVRWPRTRHARARPGGGHVPAPRRARDRAAQADARGRQADQAERDRPRAVHPRRPGVGEGRRALAGGGTPVRGPPRGRGHGGHPRPLASEPHARMGDLRPLVVEAGHERGVRRAVGVDARAAVPRVPDDDGGRPAASHAEQRPAGGERHRQAGRRAAGRRVGSGPPGRRPRRLALDVDRRRLAPSRCGRRAGLPLRARGRRTARRIADGIGRRERAYRVNDR